MAYDTLVPLWGEDFTRRYIEFFLPAQLPVLSSLRGERYTLITTPESERAVRESQAYRDLSSMMEVRFLPIGTATADYRRMSEAYEVGLRHADRETTFVFLTPDALMSLGSLDTVKRLMAGGYRAVMNAGPRVDWQSFAPEFASMGAIKGIGARSLAKLLERHLHLSMRSFMMDGSIFNTHPACLYWEVEGGFVARHFVMHPIAVRPRRPIRSVEETLDYNLATYVRRSEVYVCTDSDEFLGIDVALRDANMKHVHAGPLQDEQIAIWLQSEWPTRFHKWLGRHTVYFHSNGIGPDHLRAAAEAEATIRRLYRQIPPLGFIYSPRDTFKRMLDPTPHKTFAPWYRTVLDLFRPPRAD